MRKKSLTFDQQIQIKMNVLSLFDGMSCGQIALERAGVKVNNYYASEIDKYAIQITKKNYPNTIHVGDVTQLDSSTLPKIDLLLGGSPCQGFSAAGKKLNFNDPRSKLFFEFVRVLKETSPKYFLLENVKMKKESLEIINKYLGVEPIEINSSLVSAQNRKRLYWTNILNLKQPQDRMINLDSILDFSIPFRNSDSKINQQNPAAIRGRRLNQENYQIKQGLEVKQNKKKSNCLTTVGKDNVLTPLQTGRHLLISSLPWRYYSILEYCKLQTIPVDYFKNSNTSESMIKKMIGNGWTVDVIAHILKGIL